MPFGPQPLWFGLTQAQEARAGFDAATKLNGGKILLLQFKAGRGLARGGVRYHAQHHQLAALQQQVRGRHRLVYYVLPEATRTSDLYRPRWLVESTWFLDVGDISKLSAPARKSNAHNITLERGTGAVTITSDPVHAQASTWAHLVQHTQDLAPGGHYDGFQTFWKYAKLLGRGGMGFALP
jgi:hypothetical protein